ncbi:MAG: hypothetical protein RSD35_09045 [Oscillospiraceae bacterium]
MENIIFALICILVSVFLMLIKIKDSTSWIIAMMRALGVWLLMSVAVATMLFACIGYSEVNEFIAQKNRIEEYSGKPGELESMVYVNKAKELNLWLYDVKSHYEKNSIVSPYPDEVHELEYIDTRKIEGNS